MRRAIPTRRTATRGSLPSPNTQVVQLLVTASVCLIVMSFLPMIVLEISEVNQEVSALLTHMTGSNNNAEHHVGPGRTSLQTTKFVSTTTSTTTQHKKPITKTTKDGRHIYDLSLTDLTPDPPQWDRKPVARGIAGRPLSQTPHVAAARRAHLNCGEDLTMDSLAYWNVGGEILKSPFAVPTQKYVTFSPDRGGWNNVRMSLEIIFVIAAATGRTLVLPPKEPLYLMHHDKSNRYRGFGDFFPLEQLHPIVPVMSFQDFFFNNTQRPPVPSHVDEAAVQKAADHCDKRDASENACRHVFDYLEATGVHQNISAQHTCLIFDETAYRTGKPPTNATTLAHVQQVCGPTRDRVYFTQEMNEPDILFFAAGNKTFRLLTHFYGMIHFTNPVHDNYFRRFVRDYLHYHESIYCAAGKIVKAIQKEAALLNNSTDPKYGVRAEDGSGGYSALHVRRGDLQYKKVKIPAQEWYDNTKDVWYPNELLYIATDERDKSFFDDIKKHHELRFLDDYWDLADLSSLDPNYMGMIDTIVASRGRAYAGTWFSTFSGYINRLRGYHGLSMQDSWYGFLPKKEAVHEWKLMNEFAYAFEWPDGWIGIDADEWPSRDKF